MSINYQLIAEGSTIAAVLRNVEIPETLNSVGYAPSFYQKGTETKLKFETCIISSISDFFFKSSPNVTQIEVKNSIIDRIDLKFLKKFTNLEEFSFVNSTLNECSGTIFGGLRDFTLKFEKDGATNEIKLANVDGKIDLNALEQKEEEDVEDQASGSGVVPKPSLNGRQILARSATKFPIAVCQPAHASGISSTQGQTFGSSGLASQSFSYQPSIFGSVQPPITSTTFGTSLFSSPTSSDQSTAAKRSCDQNTSKNLDHRAHLKEKYTKSQTINANLSKDLEVLRDQIMKLEAENKKLKESGILADLKKIFHDEAFKDFTVNVNKEKSFKIHKLLFAARSSVIADMIRNNPEDFELNLQDIPLPIFEVLLHFIYNDSAPEHEDDNLIATYAAAGRLNIVDLKNLTAQKLMDKIDEKNAFRVLELSNKYGNDELRLKAFEEIKKALSDYKLTDEFSKKPEKIKKLLEMKKKMDEEYARMQQEFEDIQVVSDDQQEAAEGGSDSYEIVD
ncbi:hypothetical protein ACKWTF_014421 [Chironomus riparius]